MWCALFAATAAQAAESQTPQPHVLQGMQHMNWTGRDGAPASVMAFEQSVDGALWLGSRQGLYRFDGSGFQRIFAVDDGPASPADIYALKPTPNGDLWIGNFVAGVTLLHHDGTVSRFSKGVPRGGVTQFLQAPDGRFWASTTMGLAAFDGHAFHPVGPEMGLPTNMSVTCIVRGDGSLVVRTFVPGYFTLGPNAKRFEHHMDTLSGYLPFAVDPAGRLYESTPQGLIAIEDGVAEHRRVLSWQYEYAAPDVRIDNTGVLWATERGAGILKVWPDSQTHLLSETSRREAFHERDGLTSEQVMSNYVDRSGSLWVGTERGVDRFHTSALARVDEGLDRAYLGIAPAAGGRFWLVGFSGGAWLRDSEGNLKPSAALPTTFRKITSVTSEEKGGVWIATEAGVGLLTEKKWTMLPSFSNAPVKTVTSMHADGHGGLWIVAYGAGVVHWTGTTWQPLPALARVAVTSMAVLGDDVIVGTRDGHVIRWNPEQGLQSDRALDMGFVTALTPAQEGIWIGTDKGIGLLNAGQFLPVPIKANPFPYRISGLVRCSNGDLWLNTPVGVMHVPAQQVQGVLRHTQTSVDADVFDSSDGVEGIPLRSFLTPTARGLEDGSVVFTTQLGVYRMDVAKAAQRAIAERPIIAGVRADGEPLDLRQIQLKPHIHTLEVDYGSVSIDAPQRLVFRYRLRGVDYGWQTAGKRRQAVYTDLPPGQYDFEVQASYDGRQWSPSSQGLSMRVPPAFLQRWQVRLAALASLALLGALFVRYRLRQVYELAQLRLQARLEERERIARDLHDTLLQAVQGIILRFSALADTSIADEKQRGVMHQALERAETVVQEGRDRVRDLRSTSDSPEALENALRDAGAMLSIQSPANMIVESEGDPRRFHAVMLDELFCIGREAINNAIEHAEAQTIWCKLSYLPHEFQLVIEDDGKGMPGGKVAYKDGHWGLMGMEERARKIGGRISFAHRKPSGFRVQLTVDASLAYANARVQQVGLRNLFSNEWFWRRFSQSSGMDGVRE